MKSKARAGWASAGATLLVAYAFISGIFLFRAGLAFEDPDLALAFEAAREPSKLSYLRGRFFLSTGGSPDKPIVRWGINDPPLVRSVDSGNHQFARAIVFASSRETWEKAVVRACAGDHRNNEQIIDVLASRYKIAPERLCATAGVAP